MDVKAPSGTDKAQETQSLHVQGLHFIKSAHGGIDHITKGFCDWST